MALTWPKTNSSTTLKRMWSLLKIVGQHKNDFQLGKHWENATENVGEEPNHKNITKTKFSDSSKMKNDCPREEEIHSKSKIVDFTHSNFPAA